MCATTDLDGEGRTVRIGSVVAVLGGAAPRVLLVPPLIGAAHRRRRRHAGPRPAVPGAQRARRRLRHHRAHGGEGAWRTRSSPARCEVFNLPGAGGTVGLGRTVNESGNDRLVMSMGLGVVGAVYTNESPATLHRHHPDRPADRGDRDRRGRRRTRRYATFDELVGDVEGRPRRGAGRRRVQPRRAGPPRADADGRGHRARTRATVNYISYDGGGELLAAVLGGKVAFGVSGLGEYADQIEAGELRVLAVTAPASASRASTRPPSRRRAWTWSSPTGAASSRRPGWTRPAAPSWSRLFTDAARDAGVGGGAASATAGATRSSRRRVRRLPGRRRTTGWPGCCGTWGWHVTTWRRDRRGSAGLAARALRAGRLRAAGRCRACWCWPTLLIAPRSGSAVRPARPERGADPARRRCCCCWPCCWPSTCCAAATARPRPARTSTWPRPPTCARC